MTIEQVNELVKKAYEGFEQQPTDTTFEVWEVALIGENFNLANAALLRLLAGWETKKPPTPKRIKDEMQAQKPLVSHFSMTADEWREELLGKLKQGFVPIFNRPSDTQPTASYRWTRAEWAYDTGKRIKLLGLVFPEYAIRVNHQLQSNPIDAMAVVHELTAQL